MADDKTPKDPKGKVIQLKDKQVPSQEGDGMKMKWLAVIPVIPLHFEERLQKMKLLDPQGYMDILGVIAIVIRMEQLMNRMILAGLLTIGIILGGTAWYFLHF